MHPESCELNCGQMQTASTGDAASTVRAESSEITESHRSGLNRRPPPYSSAESVHVCSSLYSSDESRGVQESPRTGGELAATNANKCEQGHSVAADCPQDAERPVDEPHQDSAAATAVGGLTGGGANETTHALPSAQPRWIVQLAVASTPYGGPTLFAAASDGTLWRLSSADVAANTVQPAGVAAYQIGAWTQLPSLPALSHRESGR